MKERRMLIVIISNLTHLNPRLTRLTINFFDSNVNQMSNFFILFQDSKRQVSV